MSNEKRKDPTPLQKKKLQQEADSRCPFCSNTEAGAWIFHHIDGIPYNTTLDNLIMVCGACHNQITLGEISEADVRLKKSMIIWESMQRRQSKEEKTVSPKVISDSIIAEGNSGCLFTQKVVHAEKVTQRINPASDTIANNADARNRLNELVKQLGDYRLKGNPNLSGDAVMSAIWKDLAKRFHATSALKVSITKQNDVFDYLQDKIDSTMQGRINKGFRKRKELNKK